MYLKIGKSKKFIGKVWTCYYSAFTCQSIPATAFYETIPNLHTVSSLDISMKGFGAKNDY